MRKILVLRGGALGDFIVTLPALAALRQRWPAARLELAGNTTAATLALERGLLDAAHSQHESRWAALYSSADLSAAFADWLATFDLVLSFWPGLAGHFPLHPCQQFLSASAQPATAPAAAHYLAPLRTLGLYTDAHDVSLRRWQPDSATIAIHPGSGSPTKNWPLARWRDLCLRLPSPPLIITGEAESADLLVGLGTSLRQPRLSALADRLSRCRLYIGHDTGVSHLAASCGVPCILLFGPTAPATWAPPAAHVRVIHRGPSLDLITPDDVLREIQSALMDRM